MPKIRLKPALIAAAAVFAWFFAVRHGAPVWVLQSILIVAVIGGIAVASHAMKRQPQTQQERRVVSAFHPKLTLAAEPSPSTGKGSSACGSAA